jgi:hypothetical protein
MEISKEKIYLAEVENQSDAGWIASEAINLALKGGPHANSQAFAAVQSLLTAAALISKLMWPASSKPLHKERGEYLRSVLPGVAASAILADRSVRNRFEHFDEDLDEYLLTSSMFVDRAIGDPKMMVIVGDKPADYVRLIDTVELAIEVMGKRVSIQNLHDALVAAGKEARARIAELDAK